MMKRKFSPRKLFLDLLVVVCLGVVGWTGYQLFILRSLSPVSGSIIFIVDIGVLIWNVSVLRSGRYRWEAPSLKLVFLSLFVVVLVLAFAGVHPFGEYKNVMKDKVATFIVQQELAPESYPRERIFQGTYTTVVPWLGTEQTLTFKGNTVTITDELMGRNIFRYVVTMQSESEGVLELIDIATGEVSLMSLEYIKEADCVVLYPSRKTDGGVSYCR